MTAPQLVLRLAHRAPPVFDSPPASPSLKDLAPPPIARALAERTEEEESMIGTFLNPRNSSRRRREEGGSAKPRGGALGTL